MTPVAALAAASLRGGWRERVAGPDAGAALLGAADGIERVRAARPEVRRRRSAGGRIARVEDERRRLRAHGPRPATVGRGPEHRAQGTGLGRRGASRHDDVLCIGRHRRRDDRAVLASSRSPRTPPAGEGTPARPGLGVAGRRSKRSQRRARASAADGDRPERRPARQVRHGGRAAAGHRCRGTSRATRSTPSRDLHEAIRSLRVSARKPPLARTSPDRPRPRRAPSSASRRRRRWTSRRRRRGTPCRCRRPDPRRTRAPRRHDGGQALSLLAVERVDRAGIGQQPPRRPRRRRSRSRSSPCRRIEAGAIRQHEWSSWRKPPIDDLAKGVSSAIGAHVTPSVERQTRCPRTARRSATWQRAASRRRRR